MISLSGDGKAISFFLSESVQHKDKWHLLYFLEYTVNTFLTDADHSVILVNEFHRGYTVGHAERISISTL